MAAHAFAIRLPAGENLKSARRLKDDHAAAVQRPAAGRAGVAQELVSSGK